MVRFGIGVIVLMGALGGVVMHLGAEEQAKPRLPQLGDVAFIQGTWVAEAGGTKTTEHWLPASGGAMAAVTHMVRGEKTSLYELSVIEARDDGIHLSIRHFGVKLKPWASEADGAGTWSLRPVRRAADGKIDATFTREGSFPQHITYSKTSDTTLEARLHGTGKDGQPASMVFAFRRP